MAHIRHWRGDTATSNARVGKPGLVAQDTEGKALRLYDGETPGGYVITGTEVDLPTGPGPSTLQAGDTSAGFYGEVVTDDLIDGEALASEVGLTAGTPKNTAIGWLKCVVDNKIIFIAKQSLRGTIDWVDINDTKLVYGPERSNTHPVTQITLDGYTYVVRLLRGANEDPTTLEPNNNWEDPPEADQSEWKRLMEPLAQDNQWGSYTHEDLGFIRNAADHTWCQETCSADSTYHVLRGVGDSLDLFTRDDSGSRGWRPVLELIT